MNELTTDHWFLERAREHRGSEATGEVFASDGFQGIRDLVLDHASERINRFINDGDNPVLAFNYVTNGWPREARAHLAAHEFYEVDRSGFPEYLDDLDAMVDVLGGSVADEQEQALVQSPYPANPYEASELSKSEADIIMLLRAIDEETEGILEEIDDVDEFHDALKESGDVNTALFAHVFDSSLPGHLVEMSARPGEWPGGMDPGNVRSDVCPLCSHIFYKIFTEEHGQSWFFESHDAPDGGGKDTSTDPSFTCDSDRGEYVCDSCFHRWQRDAPTSRVVIPSVDHVSKIKSLNGITKDFHYEHEDEYDPVSGMHSDHRSNLEQLVDMGGMADHIGLPPGSYADLTEQQYAELEELAQRPIEIEHGPVYFFGEGSGMSIHVDKRNPDLVHEIKSEIEEVVEQAE